MKRKWDFLSKQKKDSLIREIITYFKEEKDEDIGVIAAENLLDFFLENTGETIYNKAVEDCKTQIKKNFENIEVDLDMLTNK